MSNTKLRDNLNSIFAQTVQIDTVEQRLNKELVEDCVDALLNEASNVSPLFCDMYKTKVYSGSIYEKLRVEEATEFDFGLKFQLPFEKSEAEIISRVHKRGCVQYRITDYVDDILQDDYQMLETYKRFEEDFVDDDGYLLRPNFQKFVKSQIVKAWNCGSFQDTYHKLLEKHFWKERRYYNKKTPIPNLSRHRQMAIKVHGPAITVYIVTLDGDTIGVDLVPLIQPLDGDYRQIERLNKTQRFLQLKPEQQRWFMLPKPFKGDTDDDSDTFWQVCFPEAEKCLLRLDHGNPVKKLIRLTKLLRDDLNWDELNSHFIKTLYLLELDKNPDWDELDLGDDYLMMLKKLLDALERKQLKSYFFRQVNLFASVDYQVLDSYECQLREVIEEIEYDPDNIWNYYNH